MKKSEKKTVIKQEQAIIQKPFKGARTYLWYYRFYKA